jgi:hypothetical protein
MIKGMVLLGGWTKDKDRPPKVPVRVYCSDCRREYMSSEIVWVEYGRGSGAWCCPTDGCPAMGFGRDIWLAEKPQDQSKGGDRV